MYNLYNFIDLFFTILLLIALYKKNYSILLKIAIILLIFKVIKLIYLII